MDVRVKEELAQLEQLALALQLALRGSSPQARAILNHEGFTKSRRIGANNFTWLLVGACRKAKARAS